MPQELFIFIALFSAGILALILYEEMKYRRLLQAEQDRNAMVAILSHRLRTPLTAMKWYTEMLVNGDFGKNHISQLEALHRLDDGAEGAIDLVDKFLGFSRAELDQVQSKPVSLDVNQTIKSILDSLSQRILMRRLIVHYDTSKRVVAYVDPMLLHAVLDTVISNATLYTPEKGEVYIDTLKEKEDVVVRVRDTGIGIALSDAPIVFKPFFRSAQARTMYAEGTGLGLSLAKNLIKKAGGRIWFESPPPQTIPGQEETGTVFYVHLPKG